jgi:hypothetical protein
MYILLIIIVFFPLTLSAFYNPLPFENMSNVLNKEYQHGYPEDWTIEKALPVHNKCKICYDNKKSQFDFVQNCVWQNFFDFYHKKDCGFSLQLTENNKEIVSLRYRYVQCTHNFPNNNKECPDPCKKRPCENINYAIKGSCKNTGIHRKDYTCKCTNHSVWSNITKICHVENPCKKTDTCNGESCDFDKAMMNYKCKCGEKRNGNNCEYYRNPCQKLESSSISGNKSCLPGTCIPTIGSNYYQCKCPDGFINDGSSYKYPNCRNRNDICSSLICHNGYCQLNSTVDENREPTLVAYCLCDQDWGGRICNIPMGKWVPWSEWSDCKPECGLERSRNRTRYCSDNTNICLKKGNPNGNIVIEDCPKRPCDLRHIGTNFDKQNNSFKRIDFSLLNFLFLSLYLM